MRKLFTGILLAAALPASANIATDLEAGLSADVAIANAVAACDGGATCQELAIEEALAAGIDLDSVISAAIASGVNPANVQQAAIEAGQNPADVSNAIASIIGAFEPTAAGDTPSDAPESPATPDAVEPPPAPLSNTSISPV